MKKISIYILIIIVLIGVFGTTEHANAETAGTACTITIQGKQQQGIWTAIQSFVMCIPNENTDNLIPTPPRTANQINSGPYTFLAPLPCPNGKDSSTDTKGCVGGELTTFDPKDGNGGLSNYINLLIKIVIGIAAILAVIMIVMGGIEYMTSELSHSKEAGKEKILDAILGLIVVLGAYALLNTINPKLLSTEIAMDDAIVPIDSIGGESNTPFEAFADSTLKSHGINCPGSGGKGAIEAIGTQFKGKTTYSQEKRNTANQNTLYFDCSSFVTQVYECAGLPKPGNATADMFVASDTTKKIDGKTFDFNTLHPGDLVGWRGDDNKTNSKGKNVPGHVMIYIGNGNILEQTTDFKNGGGGVRVIPIANYKQWITYAKWSK